MRVLVTGGAGYIGSLTCVQLIEAGLEPIILDNFCNSKPSVLDRIEQLTNQRPMLVKGDVRDRSLVETLLREQGIDAVIHFAGLKAVGESVAMPLEYYINNVGGTFELLAAMRSTQVRTLIFSSSATVYGDPASVPVMESAPTGCTNPYGWSKYMAERVLMDLSASDPSWSLGLLRYFNPVGAHPSGAMGEDPQGIPNNLMPFLAQVAVGRRPFLNIFGNDYATPDGTGVRDYIHVLDLADGHVAALRKLHNKPGCHIINLGTGQGQSVLDMLNAFGRACGRELPHQFAPRRPGDIAACWADPSRALEQLGWQARRTLDDMCTDTWRWQSANPLGYPD